MVMGIRSVHDNIALSSRPSEASREISPVEEYLNRGDLSAPLCYARDDTGERFSRVLRAIRKAVLFLLLICWAGSAWGQERPYSSYWFPQELKHWDPSTDPDARYNRGRAPLAERFINPATQRNPALSHEARLMAVSITHPNTSGNPSQGSDAFNVFAFNYWQYVDLFVMWGGSAVEGLILSPNATWIDAGHRNGVKVLGTVFFPPNPYGGKPEWLEEFLEEDAQGRFLLADKLIEVADYYGFDGWFINQETRGGTPETAEKMRRFLAYYQQHKKEGMEMIWYDAMAPSGDVDWQNELNDRNASFFQDRSQLLAESMFINFDWNAERVERSRQTALALHRNPYDLYAGIDVQSRGYFTPGIVRRLETLFPVDRAPRLSLAFYVPSWTYHGGDQPVSNDAFYERARIFWEGAGVAAGDAPEDWPGLARYFPARSAITTLPFVTRFNTGHGKAFFVEGQRSSQQEWNNVGVQDVLPTWRFWLESDGTPLMPSLDFEQAYNGGSSLKISGDLEPDNATTLRLFKTRLSLSSAERLSVTYKTGQAGREPHLHVGLAFEDAPETFVYLPADKGAEGQGNRWHTAAFDLGPYAGKTVAVVALRFASEQPVKDYQIHVGEIKIGTPYARAPEPPAQLKVEPWGGEARSLAVSWTFSSSDPIWYYDIFKIGPSGGREHVGRTANNVFFIKGPDGLEPDQPRAIEVVAVDRFGTSSEAVRQSLDR